MVAKRSKRANINMTPKMSNICGASLKDIKEKVYRATKGLGVADSW